jgi:hypothetical protein
MTKKVLFYLQRGWGLAIGNKCAKRLKKINNKNSFGCIVSKKGTWEKISKENIYEYKFFFDELVNDPKKYLNNDDFDLKSICDDLDILSVWPYAQSLRNHVKSYSKQFYYSFKQNLNDEEIILYIKAVYKLCKSIEKNFNPDIIIMPNFVSLQHSFLSYYFIKKGKKIIGISNIGDVNTGIFVNSPFEENSDFINELKKIEKNYNEVDQLKKVQAENYIKEYQEYLNNLSLKIKKIDFLFLKKFIKKVFLSLNNKNLIKKVGAGIDTGNFFLNIRDFVAEIYNRISTNSIDYENIDEINNFIYLPLQTQPEETIDVQSPLLNNQIETARRIAMVLPDDYTLVVKDHPGMFGLRRSSYLKKILKSPNVKLIKYNIPNSAILKKAKCVVGYSGSIFFETSLFKVKAIQLGNCKTSQLLPNVHFHNDLNTIGIKIKEIISEKINEKEYHQKLIIYVMAMMNVGFDLKNYQKLWNWEQGGDFDKFYTKFEKHFTGLSENK